MVMRKETAARRMCASEFIEAKFVVSGLKAGQPVFIHICACEIGSRPIGRGSVKRIKASGSPRER